MPHFKYNITVSGLRHGDFKDCLEELYSCVVGRRVILCVEPDNKGEKNAVRVKLGTKRVGYARSGECRECAYSLIASTGRPVMLGKVVGYDEENRYLFVELQSDDKLKIVHAEEKSELTNWTFDDRTLMPDEKESQVVEELYSLDLLFRESVVCHEDIEECLKFVEQNMWRDCSYEAKKQIEGLLSFASNLSNKDGWFEKIAKRLQYVIDYMGSPEVRKLQAQHILELAHCKEMDGLLHYYGERAKEAVGVLPKGLTDLFRQDGELFMGRMWYLQCDAKMWRALKTLLAIMVRLEDNAGEEASETLERQWILQWGGRNAEDAAVVKRMMSDYDIERRNPKLYNELAYMMKKSTHNDEVCVEPKILPLYNELLPIFLDDGAEVERFIKNVDGAKSTMVTDCVNRLLREGKILRSSSKGDLWQVLNKYKIYKPSKSNWNSQVNA